MAWSGFGQTHLVQKQSWCAGIIWPGFCQEATGPLPVLDFQTKFRSSTDVPDNIVQNQPGSHLVLVDCVRSWPNGPGPEASRCVCQTMAKRTRSGSKPVCKNHPARFWPVLPSRSGPHVYWAEFIGLPVTGRPGFIGVPLSERQAQPVTEGTIHLSINQSVYLYCHVSSIIFMRVEWGMVLIAFIIIHTFTITLAG